jgi:hypothetical protein
MAEDSRLARFLRTKLRAAGRQAADARREYESAKGAASHDLPTDEDGAVRLVCRRHAERRAVAIDGEGRPACYDGDHPDCQGCVEDVRDGIVETW